MVWICNQENRYEFMYARIKKINYYLIMYASDLMIYELRCIYAITRVYIFFKHSFIRFKFICFYLFYNNRRFVVVVRDCSRILIVYFFLFTKSVMSLMNFFLMQIYFFSYFFLDVMWCLSIYTYKRNIWKFYVC